MLNWEKNIEQNINSDPSLFWRHLNNIGQTGGYPATMFLEHITRQDGSKAVGFLLITFCQCIGGPC